MKYSIILNELIVAVIVTSFITKSIDSVYLSSSLDATVDISWLPVLDVNIELVFIRLLLFISINCVIDDDVNDFLVVED